MLRYDDHVQEPAGTVTVSPLSAASCAAGTRARGASSSAVSSECSVRRTRMPALVVAALVVHGAGTLHPSVAWGQSRNFSDYGSDPISDPITALTPFLIQL